MSHWTVSVFLLALTGIALVQGQKARCQGRATKKGKWGGRCFGTQENLFGYPKCDSLVENAPGCSDGETCCIDCSRHTTPCDRDFSGSVGRDVCCPSELKVGEVHPGSGCICCKACKRKSYCRAKKGRCVTKEDPVYNVEWCLAQPGGKIKERACYGWGCYCCIWDHSA